MTEPSPTTTSTEQAPIPCTAGKSRIGRIVCWAARLTSIPIFALLLVSLIPALTGFGVSPHDDQVIALGLCGIPVDEGVELASGLEVLPTRRVAKDTPGLFGGWVIHQEGFRAPKLLGLARLQAWTLKPAIRQ